MTIAIDAQAILNKVQASLNKTSAETSNGCAGLAMQASPPPRPGNKLEESLNKTNPETSNGCEGLATLATPTGVSNDVEESLNKTPAETSNGQKQQGTAIAQSEPTRPKGSIMAENTPVYIEKNRNTDVMVGISEYKGRTYLNIRECWLDARNPGARNPTKKGVTLNTDKLEELIAALQGLRPSDVHVPKSIVSVTTSDS